MDSDVFLIYDYMFVSRDRAWAEEKKMGSFISVSNGSKEAPLRFVEINYKGGKEGDAPLAIVGKGITFDRSVKQ